MAQTRLELQNRIRAQQAAQQQQAAADRNELFGTQESTVYQNPFVPASREQIDQMDNRQVMDHAVAMHRETTASAARGLKVVEETQAVAAATQAALHVQGKQIQGINRNLNAIREDISYSQKLLRYMRKCCLCACCGDPEAKREREWVDKTKEAVDLGAQDAATVAAYREQERSRHSQASQYAQQQELKRKYQGATYGGPDVSRIRDTYGDEVQAIEDETRKQDDYLSQIDRGLDALKDVAQNMRDEVRRQDEQLYRAQDRTDNVGSSLYEMNTRSQLRHHSRGR